MPAKVYSDTSNSSSSSELSLPAMLPMRTRVFNGTRSSADTADLKTTESAHPSKLTGRHMPSSSEYELGQELGDGSWSTVCHLQISTTTQSILQQVYIATHRATQKVFAAKVITKSHLIKHGKVQTASTERNALAKLGREALSGDKQEHNGFVKLYTTFQDAYSLCACIPSMIVAPFELEENRFHHDFMPKLVSSRSRSIYRINKCGMYAILCSSNHRCCSLDAHARDSTSGP